MTTTFDLALARYNAGYSIRGLAKVAGVAEQSVRRLETGERVHPSTAKKIADVFGVQVTDVMPFEPTEPKAAA